MNAAELIEQLESLSPEDIQAEIDDHQAAIDRLRQLLKFIDPAAVKKRRPRAAAAASDGTEIDRSVPLERRVRTYLEYAGPSGFRAIHSHVGGKPPELSAVLNGRGFVQREDKTWALKG